MPDKKWLLKDGVWRLSDVTTKWRIGEDGDPCCCDVCVCPDFTPTTWTATFANVDCSTCTLGAGSLFSGKILGSGAPTFSGTFTLTNAGGFNWTYSSSIGYSTYFAAYTAAPGCASSISNTNQLLIRLQCVTGPPNYWFVQAYLAQATGPPGFNTFWTNLFKLQGGFDCSGGTGIVNGISAYFIPATTPDVGNEASLGKDGTVDLTPNP